MSNQTHSTPLSSASSVPSSPVFSEPRSLKATRKDSQEGKSMFKKLRVLTSLTISPISLIFFSLTCYLKLFPLLESQSLL
jgi:hypothetical protein